MNYEDFKKLDKDAALKAAAAFVGVEPSVIDGLWATESGRGANKGPSRAGAQGDFQIMPNTQARFEQRFGRKFDANDFHDSLWMASAHLKDDLAREGGDVVNALRAYNNGPNWRAQKDPTGENAAYAGKVLGANYAGAGKVPVRSASLPEITLDTQFPDPLERGTRASATSKVDQLLAAVQALPPREPVSQQPSQEVGAAVAGADQAVRANDQLIEDTSFLDKTRAAFMQQGIAGAVLRNVVEEDYPPEQGFVVDPKALEGKSNEDQVELLEARSPSELAQIQARQQLRAEDMATVGRSGFWTGVAAQLVAGLPEGVATGLAMTKAMGLAGYGSQQLIAEGRAGAAAASVVVENTAANVLAAGVEETLGGRMSAEDYALGALLGVGVGALQARSAWHRGVEANLRNMEQRALQQVVERQRALAVQATEKLGPGATPDQIAAEVQRLEAEGIKQQINAAVGTVPENRRLLPEELADPYAEPKVEPGAKPAEPAAAQSEIGLPKIDIAMLDDALEGPLTSKDLFPQFGDATLPTWDKVDDARRAWIAEHDPDWDRQIREVANISYARAKDLSPGVRVTQAAKDDVTLRPAVDALRALGKQFLPDQKVIVGKYVPGQKTIEAAIAKGGDPNGPNAVIISAADVHFIGIRPEKGPTQAIYSGVHELGHAIFHTNAKHIPPKLLQRMVAEHREFLVELAAGSASARFKRFGTASTQVIDGDGNLKGALPRKGDPGAYAASFDEYTAEAFVRFIERRAQQESPGFEMPKSVKDLLKAAWERIKELFTRAKAKGYLPKDEAFEEFFQRVLDGTLEQADDVRAKLREAAGPTAGQFDVSAQMATDPLAEKYGFNLMPAATPQEAAEAKAVRALWARATDEAAPWNKADYSEKLSKLLRNTPFDNTSSAMLRSQNPVMRMIAHELLENPSGAAGRRSTAALSKFITERAIMGNSINDVQNHYAAYRAAAGQSMVRDFTDGKLWAQFNREVAEEIELRRMGGQSQAPDSVKAAADSLEGAYERARLHQVNAKTIGWGSLPESSRGYMPHRLSPERVRSLPNGQKQALHAALVDQFQSIEGFDPTFSAKLASKYIDRVESRAVGDFGAPANVHQVGAAEVVEEALAAMGMSRPEVLAAMQRYMRGGAGHTKARLKLDLLAEHDDGAGGTFRLLDLFETDQLRLLRSQAMRVSGEVALARHGVMGKAGLSLLRRAAKFGEDGAKATAKELEAFDQVASEFLGQPFGEQIGKWGDRLMQMTSLSRLGGMGFTQFAEYINGVTALGVTRVMKGVTGMPRLISEARALARGEKVNNPILTSLEHEAAEFGTDSYKMVFPFDNPELQYQLYGADTVTFADRALRGATHLQGKLSFWRAIHSAQQRGMAEQIVLKAVKYLRDGANDAALRDMGFTDDLMQRLRAGLMDFVEFDGDTVRRLDITKLQDREAANEFIQAVHRGSAQIIQGTYIGETGKWAHSGWLKLLTQFRTFSITSVEKQWGRNVNNYGALRATGLLIGAMSMAAPIYLARLYATSVGRPDREEYLAERMTLEHFSRATLNYVAMSGLAGDFLDAASAVSGLGKQTGGRTGNATEFVGNVVAPSAGLANDLWKAMQNTKEGTDPHELLKALPFSKLPLVGIGINALDD